MYNHIKRGVFREGANGPVRFRENFIVPLKPDVFEQKLEERSSVERNHVVGLFVTKPGTKLQNNRTVAATDIFDTCYLNLFQGTTLVLSHIYLYQILEFNEQGKPYEISLPDTINLADSKLVIQNSASVVDNTAIEFQIEYLKS